VVPMMFFEYLPNRAGEVSTPPCWAGPSTFTLPQKDRPTPTMVAVTLGPAGGPLLPS
jgi:hypothetical protein